MARFQPGHSGRPKGSRNKLTVRIFDDLADHWEEPAPNDKAGRTRGRKALDVMFIEEPGGYVRAMMSVLPKELSIENVTSEMDDGQLEEMIMRIREHLIAQRQEEPVLIEAKDVVTE